MPTSRRRDRSPMRRTWTTSIRPAATASEPLALPSFHHVLRAEERAERRARERPERAVDRGRGARRLVVQRVEDEVAAAALELAEAVALEQPVELPRDAAVDRQRLLARPPRHRPPGG